MTTPHRKIKIARFFSSLDEGPREDRFLRRSGLLDFAQRSEEALVDVVFRADSYSFDPKHSATAKRSPISDTDPLIALAAIAGRTSRIGLAATASTSYNAPYNLARQFLTLDHVSDGRSAWNAVTSVGGAAKFGHTAARAHTERYRVAEEFIRIVHALWGSWSTDALSEGVDGRLVVDFDKVHEVDIQGRYYQTKGALSLPRSPQNWPVQFQAGASPEGRELAAKYAEAVFAAPFDLDDGVAYYRDLKDRVRRRGRDPEKFVILPSFSAAVGSTRQQALDNLQATYENLDYETGRRELVKTFEGKLDLDDIDLDEAIPHERFPDIETFTTEKTRPRLFRKAAEKPGATLRSVVRSLLVHNGKKFSVGTYDEVTEELIQWFEAGAADGFVLEETAPPGHRDNIVAEIIPRLQQRGYFRTAYEGSTLRENLGLA